MTARVQCATARPVPRVPGQRLAPHGPPTGSGCDTVGSVLREMRDRTGGPNVLVRALALLLALLLAGPLTLLLARALVGVLDLAL